MNGLVDLRLVRCHGAPFTCEDLDDAYRLATLLASATETVLEHINADESIEIAAFDDLWHRAWVDRWTQ